MQSPAETTPAETQTPDASTGAGSVATDISGATAQLETGATQQSTTEASDASTAETSSAATTATDETTPQTAVVITYKATEGGNVSLEKQELLIETDEVEPVTATAQEGYKFKAWTINGAVVSEETTFVAHRAYEDFVSYF